MTHRGEVFRFRADQSRAAAALSWSFIDQAMPQSDDRPDEALGRLNEELQAFESGRARSASWQANRAVGDGYRLLAELIGGVLGGVGFGWLFDRFAHTSPWGIAVGVAAGAGLSVFLAAHTVARMGKRSLGEAPPPAVLSDDDED